MASTIDYLSDQLSFDRLPRNIRNRRGVSSFFDGPESAGLADDAETARRRLNQDALHRLNKYFQVQKADLDWLHNPDLPTEFEIASIHPDTREYVNRQVECEPNHLDEGYDSKEEYLQTQYELMREDTVSTLRAAVEDMRFNPYQTESQSHTKARIYSRVYITGLVVANEGLAHHLEFHTDRVEKNIAWAQSKRLKPGTLVALSPATPRGEIFRDRCLVGIIAARPMSQLEATRPEVYVYFADMAAIEFDPQAEWLMVEASNGYYEAVRHTLQALQHMRHEKFPLLEHFITGQKHVEIADALKDNPFVDIAPALVGEVKRELDIVEGWPNAHHVSADPREQQNAPAPDQTPATTLDRSQYEALRRILTKRLAIVQGPPGTGKTFVSKIALKVLLTNRQNGDPPIIVTAQTNHALDQLLKQVAPFAPNFIRLGGQTQDEDVIAPRTLYRVKEENKALHKDLRQRRHVQWKTLEGIGKRICELLEPFIGEDPIHPKFFLEAGLINEKQYKSLVEARANWVGSTDVSAESPISRWTEGDVQPFEKVASQKYFDHIVKEDDDEDLYQAKETELENGIVEDEQDTLWGVHITLSSGWIGTHSEADKKTEALLAKFDDLNDVPIKRRAPMYNYLQAKLKEIRLPRIRELATQAKAGSLKLRLARAQLDAAYLREAPVLGMTTTGLSKYRGLVSSLCPKIVLIEEAAETQEAYVTAACFESLDQLILVGDHLQLQAHCQNEELMEWNLHVSLFERLVQHQGVEFQQLTTQRRMLTEFRKTMNVIYPELEDHPSVHSREDIPGMNGINSWFMTHNTVESIDEHFSWRNEEEARLIAGFYKYLEANGTPAKDITVLTFYKGQQRALRKFIREKIGHKMGKINVSTVDAYQGEENEIIILSLVRNNNRNKIGFLNTDNRVCVAMSRARRGFYMFGNHTLLAKVNPKWHAMIKGIRKRDALGLYLPVTCKKHGTELKIRASTNWVDNDGGCTQPCRTALACGHTCPYFCHPQDHESLPCQQPCVHVLDCGHACSMRCFETCTCEACAANARKYRLEAEAGAASPGVFQDATLDQALGDDVYDALTGPRAIRHKSNDESSIAGSPGRDAWNTEHQGKIRSVDFRAYQNIKSKGISSLQATSKHPSTRDTESWFGFPSQDQLDGTVNGSSGTADPLASSKWQQFAKGGVQEDDRRRLEARAKDVATTTQNLQDLGIDSPGGQTFGSRMPLHLTSSSVEVLTPVKAHAKRSHNVSVVGASSYDDPRLNSISGYDPSDRHCNSSGQGKSGLVDLRSVQKQSLNEGLGKEDSSFNSLTKAQLGGGLPGLVQSNKAEDTPSPRRRMKYTDTWSSLPANLAQKSGSHGKEPLGVVDEDVKTNEGFEAGNTSEADGEKEALAQTENSTLADEPDGHLLD